MNKSFVVNQSQSSLWSDVKHALFFAFLNIYFARSQTHSVFFSLGMKFVHYLFFVHLLSHVWLQSPDIKRLTNISTIFFLHISYLFILLGKSFFAFGQRSPRSRWPMLSHLWVIFSSFTFTFSFSFSFSYSFSYSFSFSFFRFSSPSLSRHPWLQRGENYSSYVWKHMWSTFSGCCLRDTQQ